jgi:hypothetical protein
MLSGSNLNEIIAVCFDFNDGSACLSPDGWNFKEDKMPEKNSEWILFLDEEDKDRTFRTYRGEYGRWKATSENVREIERALSRIRQ